MRQNLIIALLAVCATLLAMNVIQRSQQQFPVALGQSVGQNAAAGTSGVVLATGVNSSGSNAVLYLYDTAQKRLAAYTVKTRGIDFIGVRGTRADLSVDYFVPKNTKISPKDVKKEIDKATKKR